MDEIKQDLHEIKQDIKQLLVTTAKHNVILDEHQKRSFYNEQVANALDKRCNMLEQAFFKLQGAWKLAGILLGCLTLAETLLHILEHFKK